MKHVIVNRFEALAGGLYFIDCRKPEMKFSDMPEPYMTLNVVGEVEKRDFVKGKKERVEKSLPYETPYLTCFWFFLPGRPDGTSVSLYMKCEDKDVIQYFKHMKHEGDNE